MKEIRNKKVFRILTVVCDALIIPAIFFCRWLSAVMLSNESACKWTTIGAKCITCGGTHFVNCLTSGKLLEAFHHNQFLFILTVFLAVSFIFWNLYVLFNLRFAKKALRIMYNKYTLIGGIAFLILFLILRNIPFWMLIYRLITHIL